MAVVLVSFLIGVGYDAYVVSGYAKEHITLNDQTTRKCPEVVEPEEEDRDEEEHAPVAALVNSESKYAVTARPKLQSKFLLKKELDQKAKEQEEADARAAEEKRLKEEREKHERDAPIVGEKRVHAWVLVLPGPREVTEPFFIEPSSGERRPIDNTDYIQIESIWNHQNYWVNMQDPVVTKGVRGMSYNLNDLQQWEYIFLKEPITVDEEENMNGSDISEKLLREQAGIEAGELDDQILDMPPSWVSRVILTPKQYEDKYPGLSKTIIYKDAKLELFAEYSQKDCLVKRITYYKDEARTQPKEIHRFYMHRVDKLLRRSNYLLEGNHYMQARKYADLRGDEAYILEYPAGHSTSNMLEGQRIHEWFAPGRRRETYIEGLKEHIYEKGVKRELRFYSSARSDGLKARIETFDPRDPVYPKKVTEIFEGRLGSDQLIFRSVKYDIERPKPSVPVGIPGLPPAGATNSSGNLMSIIGNTNPTISSSFTKQQDERAITKITERFERNPKIDADEDVAKRVFDISEGQFRLDYHYAPGRITCSSCVFNKDGQSKMNIVDPYKKTPKISDLLATFKTLMADERRVQNEIKKSEEETLEILAARLMEEKDIKYVTTVYDTRRNKPSQEEEAEMRRKMEEEARARRKKDYLTPYLPEDGIIRSKEQAINVKNACLEDLRKRLIARAKIIQGRLEEENAQLQRRRATYQKNQDMLEKNEEEYNKFCETTMFRIHILGARLDRHKHQSYLKFTELANKLKNDPRLKPFLEDGLDDGDTANANTNAAGGLGSTGNKK